MSEQRYPYPDGEIRYYGGIHKVKILPREEFDNCTHPYKGFGINQVRKKCYPCVVLEDFTTTAGKGFKTGDKILLSKSFLKKKHRSEWKRG